MRRLIGCIILFAMTIHMGILCDGCGTVHFIATSPGVELVTKIGGPYKVTCKPPCDAVRQFRPDEMPSYRVADDVFSRGYAEPGEYEVVEGGPFRMAA